MELRRRVRGKREREQSEEGPKGKDDWRKEEGIRRRRRSRYNRRNEKKAEEKE